MKVVIDIDGKHVASMPDWAGTEVSETALKAVGFDFNVSGSQLVHRIKALSAALITEMERLRAQSGDAGVTRHASIAITDIETAQMRAVKAATWR